MVKKKLTAAQRELKAAWDASLARHAKPLERGAKAKAVKASSEAKRKLPLLTIPEDRNPRLIESFDSGKGYAAKRAHQEYTGDAMVGISQMHKSNMVPVFNSEAIKDISKMRR